VAVLLDTNILIDHLRNRPAAVSLLTGLPQKPSASVLTLSELLSGARSGREETQIASLKQWIRFLDIDAAIAERAGQFIKHYRGSHGIDDFDALIAATAEQYGLRLLTLNTKHFPMFAKLRPAY
jgi:predicted nucleic acid-binding protein